MIGFRLVDHDGCEFSTEQEGQSSPSEGWPCTYLHHVPSPMISRAVRKTLAQKRPQIALFSEWRNCRRSAHSCQLRASQKTVSGLSPEET